MSSNTTLKKVFDFNNHQSYLKSRLEDETNPRGMKSVFAKHLRIQSTYLSNILSKKNSLTFEQADMANDFFKHNTIEGDFFLLLVGKDRSGSASLNKHYERQINDFLKKYQTPAGRIDLQNTLSENVQAIYFTSWLYPTLHLCVNSKELRTADEMSVAFNISKKEIEKVLSFLVANNIVRQVGNQYYPTDVHGHRLDSDSPYLLQHHTIWRNKIINELHNSNELDLHYTINYAIDLNTAKKLRELILDFIHSQAAIAAPSPAEDIFLFCLDYLKINK